jgi:23S rRNA (uracil1939-C5)-methyltransferase
MDPPRAGSTEQFLDALAGLAPSRVVYVSCNPETQVRDLCHLAKKGYRAHMVQPVDMFPHTDHVETVCLLTHARRGI